MAEDANVLFKEVLHGSKNIWYIKKDDDISFLWVEWKEVL